MNVSIIVTSYNYEKYIGETLQSIVNQTYKNYEVIIVDDGSCDNSVEIIRQFTEKYSNFHLYFHEGCKNKGLTESLKLGISKSTSDYIAFLESDDLWSEEYLEEKIKYLKQHPDACIIVNDIKAVGSDIKNDYINWNRRYYLKRNNNKNDFDFFYNSNGIATFSAVFIRKDVLSSLNFNSPVPQWLDWWLYRQVAIKYPIHFIDKRLTLWRVHKKSYNSVNLDEELNKQNIKKMKRVSNILLIRKYTIPFIKYIFPNLLKTFTQELFSIKNSTEQKTQKIVKIFGIKFTYKKDIYNLKNKKITQKNSVLIIADQLTYSGAPLILLPLIDYIKKRGREVVVLAINGGPMKKELKKRDIKTYFVDIFNQQEEFINFAKQFKMVICNTIKTYPAVYLLNNADIDYIWWLHESVSIFDYIKEVPVKNGILPPLCVLKEAKAVFTESPYAARKFISDYSKNVKILPYYLEDNINNYSKNQHSKVVFTMVGSIDTRKAQDILIEAIKILPQQYHDKILIDIVGDCLGIYAQNLIEQMKDYSFVNFKGFVDFNNKNELYRNTDVLVSVSRDDPMPVVVYEAMSFEIPCIVSDHVGQSDFIQNGQDGFIIHNENIEELRDKIIWCVDNKDKLAQMGKKSRLIYEKNASYDNIDKCWRNIL